MSDRRRLPAEWEIDNAVLLTWPHKFSDWEYMLDEVESCYLNIIEQLAKYVKVRLLVHPAITAETLQKLHSHLGDAIDAVEVIPLDTNDTWTRDYGPITTIDDGKYVLNDFKFNGWGLKFAADKDNLVNQRLYGASCDYANRLNFVLEGGSIESDGHGALLTTTRCLMSPNRNGQSSREEIERYLIRTLGVEKVLWVDHGNLAGDDTDSHIDTLARFAPDGTILYVACDDENDPHFAPLQSMKADLEQLTDVDGNSYTLVALPWPDGIYDVASGERLPATYANFLVTSEAVFVPTYAQPANDAKALEIIGGVFKNHKIIGIDCRALIRQHGSLHCATMQLPY
ncbi:MAG: agmatine deiminase family protein [Muribaculaceae bacterium]|nr:agmatine deiminase family protein [Muribaculaceae bacterium]